MDGRENMTTDRSSRLAGFYRLSPKERRDVLSRLSGIRREELELLDGTAGISINQANRMIENAVGVFGLPLGIAANFVINGRDVIVPMVIEEPSVVAGASLIAKLVRENGGFQAESAPSVMIAQIQVLDISDLHAAKRAVLQQKDELLLAADQVDPVLKQLGGGARDLEIRILADTPAGSMLILHLLVDTVDAMGANTVNTIAEKIAPRIEALTGGRVNLRILSNLADRRMAKSSCRIRTETLQQDRLSGEEVRDRIIEAWAFAEADPYRAATHNKGIMNGIDAVLIATGNDWRAVEAGAHAYAARHGRYSSLTHWRVAEDGSLEGSLEMPMAIGIVGGATRVHPLAKICIQLLEVKSARELAEVALSVGLAQNLAALRALATEGIQKGHMRLHARQVAIAAGVEDEMVERVVERMISDGNIHVEAAREILEEMKAFRLHEGKE
jgi:hydroxymethylglutaryl-CoA reductase